MGNCFPAPSKARFSTEVTWLRSFSLILKPCSRLLFNLNRADLYRECFVLAGACTALWCSASDTGRMSWFRSKLPQTSSHGALGRRLGSSKATPCASDRKGLRLFCSTSVATSWNKILLKKCLSCTEFRKEYWRLVHFSGQAQVYFPV